MNAPKKLIGEIKAQEGSMIEITGITKKGQLKPDGVAIGGGVRVGPGPAFGSGGLGSPDRRPDRHRRRRLAPDRRALPVALIVPDCAAQG